MDMREAPMLDGSSQVAGLDQNKGEVGDALLGGVWGLERGLQSLRGPPLLLQVSGPD